MNEHVHGEHCGCGEEHEDDVFLVTDAEGKEHEMVIVYTFESEDQAYAVLLDRNEPDADGIIFRIEQENEEAFLVSIEDDEEWERVAGIYNKIAAEETNH